MTIRYVLLLLTLSPAYFSSVSFAQNWEWVESLFEFVIEPYELKAILLIMLGSSIWRLRGRLYSFTDKMIDLAYDFLFLFLKFVIVFFKFIGIQLTLAFIFIGLFFGIFLIKNASDLAHKNHLKQTAPNVSKQKLQDLEQSIQKAADRYLLRKILKLRDRPEDQAMAILSGAHKTNIPQISEFHFKLRQKYLLELLKAEKSAGYQCDFRDAYLLKMDFSRSLLKAHGLEGVLEGADFSSAHLLGSKFKETDLRGANFSNARLMHVHFIDCNLIDANFEGADLQSAILSGSRLEGARFHGTRLLQTFFTGAYLSGAYTDSPDWIEDYHRLNGYSRVFRIKWYSIVEEKDEQGNSFYLFRGENPPVKAQKP
ncbi:MAG: pentapeptide repeat-containing protein [Gimesia sp.]